MTNSSDTTPTGSLRLRYANREQVAPILARLEGLLPVDHLARLVWDALGLLDLSAFYEHLIVNLDGPGRAAADSKVLVAVWLYATSQRVTSAREVERLCVEHLAYIWLCGGVTMNYHTLSDFRVEHTVALSNLLTELVGRLMAAGLVELEQVAQDGMRVRASAGAASFRREPTLESALVEARVFVAEIEAGQHQTSAASVASQAAQERAARERVERLEAAVAAMPAARATKKTSAKKDEARVSTTDAEAHVMKMGDGGYRPAYNFQFAVDAKALAIVGVDVTTQGTDMGQLEPMLPQVTDRCGRLPKDWLMDGGFASLDSIEAGAAAGTRVLAPVRASKDPTRDLHTPLPDDSPAVAAWRERMNTDEAKATYKLRAATVECVNAHARSRYGVQQLRVRSLAKVKSIAYWVALTHDLLLWLKYLVSAPVSTPILV